MRVQFSLRAMFLAVFVVAVLLAMFTPVAKINPGTCARITRGMTVEQASNVIGASPGWYDGVGGVSSEEPEQEGPDWIGLNGQIILALDESGRVQKATFYPTRTIAWSLGRCFWERFTRSRYLRWTEPARIGLFFGLTALATFVLGIGAIPADAKNATAYHGAIGMALGVLVALAVFAEDFEPGANESMLAVALFSPVLGAVTGVAVGIVAGIVRRRLVRGPKSAEPATSATATSRGST